MIIYGMLWLIRMAGHVGGNSWRSKSYFYSQLEFSHFGIGQLASTIPFCQIDISNGSREEVNEVNCGARCRGWMRSTLALICVRRGARCC